jgi:hypothetical protein
VALVKKRILLLTTLAALLAAAMALSGVAQAKSPVGNKADAKCLAEASKTLQPGFNHADYTFIGGTEEIDDFTDRPTAGADVICGFGGDDPIFTLDAGDIFLGGDGADFVAINNGTFYGGEGDDFVRFNSTFGAFYGGGGDDSFFDNFGIFVED